MKILYNINVYTIPEKNMTITQAVVIRIKELCFEQNLSYNAMANVSGLPPSTLKNIINGNSKNPGISTIKTICDGLDISIKDFFDSDVFDSLEQEIY